jgi:hypothetical protein
MASSTPRPASGIFYFAGVADWGGAGESTKTVGRNRCRELKPGQNHTAIATMRTQNPHHSLRVCVPDCTMELSGQPPE